MFVLVGASHRAAPPVLRSLFDDSPPDLPVRLATVRAAGVAEAVWLVTCDRIEVCADATGVAPVRLAVARILADLTGEPPAVLADALYGLDGAAACRHFFAMSASLDSRVVGEPHVLGQVKQAIRAAATAGMVGPGLDPVLRAALAVAKRVRSETQIGEGPTSMAAAAVQVARTVFDRLAESPILLLGGSEMGLLLVDRLRAAGSAAPLVWTQRPALTDRLATRLGGSRVDADGLGAALPQADIVVTAVGSGRPLVTRAMLEGALRRRRRRPMLVFDCAAPSDVDPGIAALDEAFLYGLDDLEDGALAGRARRAEATAQAWRLVDAAVERLFAETAERRAVPTVVMLRRHFEAARAALLAQHHDLSAADATRLLVNRLLHAPSAALRRLARDGDPAEHAAAERLLATLFLSTARGRCRPEAWPPTSADDEAGNGGGEGDAEEDAAEG